MVIEMLNFECSMLNEEKTAVFSGQLAKKSKNSKEGFPVEMGMSNKTDN